MEIMAAIIALEHLPADTSVLIYSDSQYLVNTINLGWSRGKNYDLWNRLGKAMRGKLVDFEWVKGHNGNTFNERCDALATEAMNSTLLERDNGYYGRAASVANNPVSIDIAQNDSIYTGEEKKVSDVTKAAIWDLNVNKKPSFADYLVVKTGGIDGWSRVPKTYFEESLSEPELEYFVTSGLSDKDVLSALRWYGRGLRADRCIKKVLVSNEVAKNAMSRKQ